MCSPSLSKDAIKVRARRLSMLFVSRCYLYVTQELGISIEEFCAAGDLNLNGFNRILAGKFTPPLAYLLHVQYLVEWFWTRSSVTTDFPGLREML